MVGAFVAALTAALAANRVNALALPVENVAVPRRSLADGAPCVSLITALLELRSSSRAAPARTCTLPCMSVLRRSPPNRVVPISAAASPTCARSAAITVPRLLAAGAPKAGIVTRLAASTAAKIVRRICIGASRLLHRRILRPANAVNQETPVVTNSLRGFRFRASPRSPLLHLLRPPVSRSVSGDPTNQELGRNGKLEKLVKKANCPADFYPRLRKWLWKVVPNDFHFH